MKSFKALTGIAVEVLITIPRVLFVLTTVLVWATESIQFDWAAQMQQNTTKTYSKQLSFILFCAKEG
jgi:hypothetical protein